MRSLCYSLNSKQVSQEYDSELKILQCAQSTKMFIPSSNGERTKHNEKNENFLQKNYYLFSILSKLYTFGCAFLCCLLSSCFISGSNALAELNQLEKNGKMYARWLEC